MCMVRPCHSFVDGLSKKCINVYKKVKLINHDCLPILMLLYIMLYIMLAYLMLLLLLYYLYVRKTDINSISLLKDRLRNAN